MKARNRFLASALLALGLVSTAHAGDELYLRWDDCFGDGGVYSKTFACDSNAGTNYLVGSFRLAQTVQQMTGIFGVVHVQGIGQTLSPWWDYHSQGGCRQGSLGVTFAPPVTSTACLDPWSPRQAIGGMVYEYPAYGIDASSARLRFQVAVPAGSQFTVPAGQEHFALLIRIDHARTTGSPTCAGCAEPVCIGWGSTQVTVVPGTGSNFNIIGSGTPNNGSNVTWQPGGAATTIGSCPPNRNCETYVLCQSVTPTRVPTWGSIKTLYR